MRLNGKVVQKANYRCEKCEDTEFVLTKVRDEDFQGNELNNPDGSPKYREVARTCECRRERLAERFVEISEMTPEFKSKNFKDFIVEGKDPLINDMKNIAINYFTKYDSIKETRQNSIALLGQPGSGKTHLLSALANNLIKKKVQRVLYFPYIEGFNSLKGDFDRLNARLTEMNRVDVLFIDDLFKGNYTDWEFKQMMGVINYRYLNNKPMLISSEFDVGELCKIDEALGSRIYEMSKDYTISAKGKGLNHRLS